MPSLPPFFNGNISGVLTVYISDISWYKNDPKITHVLLEWNGSHDKHKLLTSKFSKITYDIRTSYKSFLYYLSTCTLKCSVKCRENKTFAYASTKNLILTEGHQLIKTLPLINNEEIIGILQLCFNLQTFNDTSFDNDIKYLTQFGIQNEILNTLNGNDLYFTETFKPRKEARPISNSSSNLSSKTCKSKEELACDYLMGKDMGLDEEEEALSTLKIMPSSEKIVETAEKTDIYSESISPLQIQGNSKLLTNIKCGVKNINTTQTNVKKPCSELNKNELKQSFNKKLQKATISKDNVYLQLSILSINIYHTVRSFQKNPKSTFIVQCLKDQEPYKLLRFMSRHVDDNVVQFKNATHSSLLDGCTAKGITIKVYVRILSQRSPIVLGETKQMLDWTGFSATLDVCRCVKIPIWYNNKITGHLSLSYTFSKTPSVRNYKDNFSEIFMDDVIDIIESPEKEQPESSKVSVPLNTENKKKSDDSATPSLERKHKSYENDRMYPKKDILTNKISYDKWLTRNFDNTELDLITAYQKEDQRYLYDRMYPEKDVDILSQPPTNDCTKKKPVKLTKGVQTNFEVRQFDKSVQTQLKTSTIAIQVNSDELLEDPLDSMICCDVQNIFRCTHEFTFNIKKKCNSTFNYVTYQFPECITNNIGKVITCCRLFRTFGNTNILHLIVLPTTITLDTYLCNYYKKAAIVFNLHQSDNNYPLAKVSLLVSNLIDMANEFKTSHVTKNVVLSDNLFVHESSNNKVFIEVHYKKVYHSFPPPKQSPKNSSGWCSKRKLSKKNSKVIVDLTESDSEDGFMNKTYTLFENNDRLVKMSERKHSLSDSTPAKVFHSFKNHTESSSTQTELIPVKMLSNGTQTKQFPANISWGLKTCTENSNTQTEQIPVKIPCDTKIHKNSNSSQTDPIPNKMSSDCMTQTEIAVLQQCLSVTEVSNVDKKNIGNAAVTTITVPKNKTSTDIKQEDLNFYSLNSTNIFKAKVTIVRGYDFPMVKLIGDTVATAPTTCIIMKDHGEHTFSTSTVVETTNPVWNFEWTIELPKSKLIKGEFLLLQLWCKKYKNEYAGHDAKRDKRLGFIIINVCALTSNKGGELYDVISETEDCHGQVKVLIDLIDCVDSQRNRSLKSKQIYNETAVNVSHKNQNLNDHFISGAMLEEIKTKNSSPVAVKKHSDAVKDDECRYTVDLTLDSPPKTIVNPIDRNGTKTNENCMPQQVDKKIIVHVKEKNKKSNEEYTDNNWNYVDLTVDPLEKAMVDQNVDYNDTQTNENCLPQRVSKKKVVHIREKNKKSNKEYAVGNGNNWDCVDLTVDDPLHMVSQIPFQSTTKSCLKDCFSNYDNSTDSRTVSSVASWTSSSNEILCSKNSWVTNTITT